MKWIINGLMKSPSLKILMIQLNAISRRNLFRERSKINKVNSRCEFQFQIILELVRENKIIPSKQRLAF